MQSTAEAGAIIRAKTEEPQRQGSRFGDTVRQWQLGREFKKIYSLQEQATKNPEGSASDGEKVTALLEKARGLATDSEDGWRKLLSVVNSLVDGQNNPPFSKAALEFIERNIDQVERGIAIYDHSHDKRRALGTHSFHALALLLKLGDGEQISKATTVFRKFEKTYAQEIERQTDRQVTSDIVAYLLYLTGKDTQASVFFPDAKGYLDGIIYRLPTERCSRVLKGIEAYDQRLVRGYAERAVARIIGDEEVARDMVRSWQVLSEDKITWRTDPEIVARNKVQIKELEEWKPGSARSLYDRAGITWFSRYPVKVLKDQFTNFDDVTKPYGVVLSAYYEHNNAFNTAAFVDVFSQYYDELTKLGYSVRILEARSRMTLTRRFVDLNALYGEGRKCQFMIVNAHGSTTGIRLGDDGDKRIEIGDFSSRTSEFLKGIYGEAMPVVFNSCHSFAIAKALADKLNVITHGSPVIGRMKELTVRQGKNGLSLTPTYIDSDDKEFAAATYINN